MDNKKMLVIGGWDYPWNEGGVKGVNFYENKEQTKKLLPECNVGTQVYDPTTKIDYICEETSGAAPFGKGTGGYIVAIRMSDGKLLSRVRTYGCNPTQCAFDHDRKYLIVAHHNEPSIDSTEAKTGCPVNLYALNEDGSIGKLLDRIVIKEKKTQLHSIYAAPNGKFFVINDCGGDALVTLKIVDEKLVITGRLQVEEGYNPRYGVFHPTLPLYFGNNERVPEVSTYAYDEEGNIKKLANLNILVGDEKATNNGIIPASDIIMHPSGKFLYTALRKVDRIVAMSIDEEGDLKLIQSVDCGGEGTRGLTMDAEGEHIYICNHTSGEISVFNINDDGTVANSGELLEVENGANILVLNDMSVEDWPKPFRPMVQKKSKK